MHPSVHYLGKELLEINNFTEKLLMFKKNETGTSVLTQTRYKNLAEPRSNTWEGHPKYICSTLKRELCHCSSQKTGESHHWNLSCILFRLGVHAKCSLEHLKAQRCRTMFCRLPNEYLYLSRNSGGHLRSPSHTTYSEADMGEAYSPHHFQLSEANIWWLLREV